MIKPCNSSNSNNSSKFQFRPFTDISTHFTEIDCACNVNHRTFAATKQIITNEAIIICMPGLFMGAVICPGKLYDQRHSEVEI